MPVAATNAQRTARLHREKDFDFLGHHFGRDGLRVSDATVRRFAVRANRLLRVGTGAPSGTSARDVRQALDRVGEGRRRRTPGLNRDADARGAPKRIPLRVCDTVARSRTGLSMDSDWPPITGKTVGIFYIMERFSIARNRLKERI